VHYPERHAWGVDNRLAGLTRLIPGRVVRPLLHRWRTRSWPVGPPDFVGVGAQRSGTSWWYRLLSDHPGIHAAAKELHFFDRYFDREFSDADVLAYHRLFRRPGGQLVGEWSPRYMSDFWTPALLQRAAPDARILVLLRDPMRRYQSGVSHEMNRFLRGVRRGPRRQHAASMCANDALSRSLYGRQLRWLLEQFDREQVLVLQYERCAADPAGELRRTYEFLGLDAVDHLPPFVAERPTPPHPQIVPGDAVTRPAVRLIRRDMSELKRLIPELDLELWPSCAS
jgi:Sulfotransferase domain